MPLGNLAGRWLSVRLGLGRALLLSAVVAVSGPLLYPLASPTVPLPWLVTGSLLSGLGQGSYNVSSITARQLLTPPALLGRMSAVFRFLIWGAMPIGSTMARAVGTAFGLRAAIAVGGVGQLLCIPLLLAPALLRTGQQRGTSRRARWSGPSGGGAEPRR